MKLYNLFFLIALVTAVNINCMQESINKKLVALAPTAPNYDFCARLQELANLLLCQDEIMRISQRYITSHDKCYMLEDKLKKMFCKETILPSGAVEFLFYVHPETDIGVNACYSLATLMRCKKLRKTDLPKEGKLGYRFLFSEKPEIADNPDIQKIRDFLFVKIDLAEEYALHDLLDEHLHPVLKVLRPIWSLFKNNEKIQEYSRSLISYTEALSSYEIPDDDTLNHDKLLQERIQKERPIVESYLSQRERCNSLYKEITKALRSIILKAMRTRQACPSGSWMDFTSRFDDEKFPDALPVWFVDTNAEQPQPVKLLKGKQAATARSKKSNTLTKSPKSGSGNSKPVKNPKSKQKKSRHQLTIVEQPTPQESCMALQKVVEVEQSIISDDLGEIKNENKRVEPQIMTSPDGQDGSSILDDETDCDHITIIDPKNKLKLCLYRTDPLYPVVQEMDRQTLWQNYASNVKQWFTDKSRALQEQGYLDPLNTKRYVRNEQELAHITRIHSFALKIDELLKSLGSQHEIESRLPGQKEKDLCVTIPGHFEELDKKDGMRKTCLLVFLQNGLTKKWYHRLIEEKSKHILVEEYLRDGYNQVAFPSL